MKYDLIVIGAGPSGLMTSKIAAQKGLKVLLVELKKEIENNLRLCASVLYIKPGFHGDSEILEDDKIVFVENDFAVRYEGGYETINEWFYLSPGGKRFRMGKKHSPAALAIDKSNLLKCLIEDAKAEGVKLWDESAALRVENTDKGVKVLIKKQYSEPQWIEGKKCVVSDGICSRTTMVSFPDLWSSRKHLAAASGIGYLAENINSPWGDNIWALCKNRFGSAYFLPTPMKSRDGNKVWKVLSFSTDPATRQEKAKQSLDCLVNEDPTAPIFKDMKILGREGCAWDFYSPIIEPAIENTLLVGDVCAMQEVDIQGALACGFRAANAVHDEINGINGFDNYTEWWQGAFEFNQSDDPMKHLAKGFGLFALGAEVLDYWFSLTENDMMNAFIDHNNLGAFLEAGFNNHRSTIEKERPHIAKTLDEYFGISAEEAYKGYKKN
ncbi:hypothetical protein ACFL20_09145 [Spirochaetota bacterium]